jgi:hypothetical protein
MRDAKCATPGCGPIMCALVLAYAHTVLPTVTVVFNCIGKGYCDWRTCFPQIGYLRSLCAVPRSRHLGPLAGPGHRSSVTALSPFVDRRILGCSRSVVLLLILVDLTAKSARSTSEHARPTSAFFGSHLVCASTCALSTPYRASSPRHLFLRRL